MTQISGPRLSKELGVRSRFDVQWTRTLVAESLLVYHITYSHNMSDFTCDSGITLLIWLLLPVHKLFLHEQQDMFFVPVEGGVVSS